MDIRFIVLIGVLAADPGAALSSDASARGLDHGAPVAQSRWVTGVRPTAEAGAALELLASTDAHGLEAPAYFSLELRARYARLVDGSPDAAQAFDTLLSLSLEKFVTDMRPVEFENMPPAERESAIDEMLDAASQPGGIGELTAQVVPTHPQYAALQKALLALRDEPAAAAAAIGPGPTLETGDRGARVAALRSRLGLPAKPAAAGSAFEAPAYRASMPELPPPATAVFDTEVEAAVRDYQTLHGLEADGKVGPATRAHLDMGSSEIAHRIRLNLARWRRLPIDLGKDYVHVNIPEYRLTLTRDDAERLRMRVVVGSRANPTPVFTDEIEYLVFNPYWYVPRRIWAREILPQAIADPDYLAANGYELLRRESATDGAGSGPAPSLAENWDAFSLRQRPGPNNALGTVKFIFPNEFNVYLHDSPARHLYDHSRRAFSHGCVRVEAPDALAGALLESETSWDADAVSDAFANSRNRHVRLSTPLPVYLTYMTATVTDDGRLSLPQDIYGHDRAAAAR